MNALTHDFEAKIYSNHDVQDFDFEHENGTINATLMFSVDMDSHYDDRTGETYITAVNEVEVVGLNLGCGVQLDRDQLIKLTTPSTITALEMNEREKLEAAL